MTLKRHVGVILFVYLLSLSARVCESHTVSSSSVVRGGDELKQVKILLCNKYLSSIDQIRQLVLYSCL